MSLTLRTARNQRCLHSCVDASCPVLYAAVAESIWRTLRSGF